MINGEAHLTRCDDQTLLDKEMQDAKAAAAEVQRAMGKKKCGASAF